MVVHKFPLGVYSYSLSCWGYDDVEVFRFFPAPWPGRANSLFDPYGIHDRLKYFQFCKIVEYSFVSRFIRKDNLTKQDTFLDTCQNFHLVRSLPIDLPMATLSLVLQGVRYQQPSAGRRCYAVANRGSFSFSFGALATRAVCSFIGTTSN